MNKPLFLDPTIKMEKVAFDTRLDSEPEEWPVEVVRESYKQLPFLKSYETEVEFDKIDTARGFAVGKMLVWPARMSKTAAGDRKQLVTMPLIVRNRELSPLDVFTYEGSMNPMDQDKVASILFRPQMFERPAPQGSFRGTQLSGQLTPPTSEHQYNAGSLNKHGHVGQSFWSTVVQTFRPGDLDALGEKLASSPPLRHAYTTTPILKAALGDMLRAAETSKTASSKRDERLSHLKPTVVQVKEAGKNYSIKTANRHCYEPTVKIASRFDVQRLLSHNSFQNLLSDGVVTLTTEAVDGNNLVEKTAQEATRLGWYEVSRNGEPYLGVVIPKTVDFDGRTLDMQVFSGLNSHSLQEKVAGHFAKDVVLTSDEPTGLGVFVYQEGNTAVATEPVRIESKVKVAHEHGSSITLLATRMATGSPLRISLVPGLRKIAMIGGSDLALPDTMRFLALRGKQANVSSTPAEAQVPEHKKVASSTSVEVVSDGDFFSLRGSNAEPCFKHEIMTGEEAEFALCALGLTGSQARGTLKTAAAKATVTVPVTRMVVPESVRGYEAMSKVASVMSQVPSSVRVDLVPELAIMASPAKGDLAKVASVVLARETADAILSLGFVTPENASLYVNYLPDLEKVSSRLAELLVASRLGMDDVRETAAKNAMTQVNAVVKGLETLRERIN